MMPISKKEADEKNAICRRMICTVDDREVAAPYLTAALS